MNENDFVELIYDAVSRLNNGDIIAISTDLSEIEDLLETCPKLISNDIREIRYEINNYN